MKENSQNKYVFLHTHTHTDTQQIHIHNAIKYLTILQR
jgi:hypothetical protein